MHEQTAERFERLYEAGLTGFWAVNVEKMTPEGWDDLISSQPGRIVRVYDVEAVKFVPTDTQGLEGCIAGWISEDEERDIKGPTYRFGSEVDGNRGAHG